MMAVFFQSEQRLQCQESVELVLIEPELLVADEGHSLRLLSRDFSLTSPIFLKTDKHTSSFFLVIGTIKIRRQYYKSESQLLVFRVKTSHHTFWSPRALKKKLT